MEIPIRAVPTRPQLTDAMFAAARSLIDGEPVASVSCLTTKLPLRFHGLYEAMVMPGVILTPAGAPDIDVVTSANDPKFVDAALKFATVHEWCNNEKGKVVQQVRQLWLGERKVLEDWRLWQISIEQDYCIGFHFESRRQDILTPIATLRMPLPLQSNINFRILDEVYQPQIRHKLYLATYCTDQYGRELRATEWIMDQGLVQVAWWLDTNKVDLGHMNQPNTEAIDRLRES